MKLKSSLIFLGVGLFILSSCATISRKLSPLTREDVLRNKETLYTATPKAAVALFGEPFSSYYCDTGNEDTSYYIMKYPLKEITDMSLRLSMTSTSSRNVDCLLLAFDGKNGYRFGRFAERKAFRYSCSVKCHNSAHSHKHISIDDFEAQISGE